MRVVRRSIRPAGLLGFVGAVAIVAAVAGGPQRHLARAGPIFTPGPIFTFIGPFHLVPPQDVLTQHDDNARTGAQLSETQLTPSNVAGSHLKYFPLSTFGLQYDRDVDGGIVAQPLYVHGLGTPAGVKNVVLVATANDSLYAFDADDMSADAVDASGVSTKSLWPARRLEVTGPTDICGETNPGIVGVTSTPVIDIGRGVMFVVARRKTTPALSDHGTDWLHEVSLYDGHDVLPAVQVASSGFNAQCQRNRPGLLLQNGIVYVAYGTYTCDAGCPGNVPYRGWVFGFKETDLSTAMVFNDAGSSGGAKGIWQTGNGIAGNGTSLYLQTGNDIPATNPAAQYADSFLKLTPDAAHGTLDVAAWYQPSDAPALGAGDTDLGSGGPLLLPNGYVVGGGKQGTYYLLDAALDASSAVSFQAFYNSWHLGPTPNPRYPSVAAYATPCPETDSYGVDGEGSPCYIPPNTYQNGEAYGPNIHGGPVYWQTDLAHGYIYKMAERDFLTAFRFDQTTVPPSIDSAHPIVSTIRPPDGMPGGFSTISANGTANGILWTSYPLGDAQWNNTTGRLIAQDALTLKLLWANDATESVFAKSVPPTVADGRVFLATLGGTHVPGSGRLQVYGMRSLLTVHVPPLELPPPYTIPIPDPAQMIAQRYALWGGAAGPLGVRVGGVSSLGSGIYVQRYRGYVLGGGQGGVPVAPGTDLRPLECANRATSKLTEVDSAIYFSAKAGVHVVRGELLREYLAEGGPLKLGLPTSEEVPSGDGYGKLVRFERGSLSWLPGRRAAAQLLRR